MFKCNNCGAEFEEFDVINDNGEKWNVCPCCRGTEFDEAKKCEYCGNWFLESRVNEICEDCIDEIEVRFSKTLHNNFTEFERGVLNVIYDGRCFE